MRVAAALLFTLIATATASADPIKLRMATVAPEGTAWARVLVAFARDIEEGTHGGVHVKIYYGSIAGDEFTVLDRIRRDQLDGAIGSESCMKLGPSMRVTRVVAMFQSRDESAYVLSRLKPVLDDEFAKNGFVYLGSANLGPEVLFTRQPITSVADLKRARLWIWDLDSALAKQAKSLGLNVVPRPLEDAGSAYDHGDVDGFIAIPAAGLAFQFSTRAKYLEDLRVSYRNGCVFIARRAFDVLPVESRHVVEEAAAKLRVRVEELGRREDDELLGGLFERQGIKSVPVSERFRSEFFDVAQDARRHSGSTVVDEKLMTEVLSWLADYRVVHNLQR